MSCHQKVFGGKGEVTDEEAEKHMNIIRGHATRLKDAGFDTVQIFATTYDQDEGARHFSFGHGNFYGRYGHVRMWLERERAAEWAREIKE